MTPLPKTKAVRDKKYLKAIRKDQPEDTVPMHETIKRLKRISVKGTAQKDHDCWAIRGSYIDHHREHHGNETYWGDDSDTKKAELILAQWLDYNPDIIFKLIEYGTLNWKELNK